MQGSLFSFKNTKTEHTTHQNPFPSPTEGQTLMGFTGLVTSAALPWALRVQKGLHVSSCCICELAPSPRALDTPASALLTGALTANRSAHSRAHTSEEGDKQAQWNHPEPQHPGASWPETLSTVPVYGAVTVDPPSSLAQGSMGTIPLPGSGGTGVTWV